MSVDSKSTQPTAMLESIYAPTVPLLHPLHKYLRVLIKFKRAEEINEFSFQENLEILKLSGASETSSTGSTNEWYFMPGIIERIIWRENHPYGIVLLSTNIDNLIAIPIERIYNLEPIININEVKINEPILFLKDRSYSMGRIDKVLYNTYTPTKHTAAPIKNASFGYNLRLTNATNDSLCSLLTVSQVNASTEFDSPAFKEELVRVPDKDSFFSFEWISNCTSMQESNDYLEKCTKQIEDLYFVAAGCYEKLSTAMKDTVGLYDGSATAIMITQRYAMNTIVHILRVTQNIAFFISHFVIRDSLSSTQASSNVEKFDMLISSVLIPLLNDVFPVVLTLPSTVTADIAILVGQLNSTFSVMDQVFSRDTVESKKYFPFFDNLLKKDLIDYICYNRLDLSFQSCTARQDWSSHSQYMRGKRVSPAVTHLLTQSRSIAWYMIEYSSINISLSANPDYSKAFLCNLLNRIALKGIDLSCEIYWNLKTSRVRAAQWVTDIRYLVYAYQNMIYYVEKTVAICSDLELLNEWRLYMLHLCTMLFISTSNDIEEVINITKMLTTDTKEDLTSIERIDDEDEGPIKDIWSSGFHFEEILKFKATEYFDASLDMMTLCGLRNINGSLSMKERTLRDSFITLQSDAEEECCKKEQESLEGASSIPSVTAFREVLFQRVLNFSLPNILNFLEENPGILKKLRVFQLNRSETDWKSFLFRRRVELIDVEYPPLSAEQLYMQKTFTEKLARSRHDR